MPTPQPDKQLHVLCHEHHVEMSVTESFPTMVGLTAQTSAYGCPVADCPVYYTVSNGYFISANQEHAELDMMPRITCPRDGQPMYLAEINREKKAFRLWRCPQCNSSWTNEENLVNNIP